METTNILQVDIRRYLADYFIDMADWHSSTLHADDRSRAEDRGANADFYRSLADHILNLVAEDFRLVALSRLGASIDQTGFFPGPRASAAIADVGRFTQGSPAPFLEQLVLAALDDQLDHGGHATPILIESAEIGGSRVQSGSPHY